MSLIRSFGGFFFFLGGGPIGNLVCECRYNLLYCICSLSFLPSNARPSYGTLPGVEVDLIDPVIWLVICFATSIEVLTPLTFLFLNYVHVIQVTFRRVELTYL